MPETLNQAMTREILGFDSQDYEVGTLTRMQPRTLANGDVSWLHEMEFYDDETGEHLLSKHYVTVSREKPNGFTDGEEFETEWRD